MLRRFRLALRLGYLTGRAALHVLMSRYPIGRYCIECNSVIDRGRDGRVKIIASGRPCPVHLAWDGVIRAGIEP